METLQERITGFSGCKIVSRTKYCYYCNFYLPIARKSRPNGSKLSLKIEITRL